MTKRYKNKVHRAMNDMNWDWTDDGYEYTETGPHRLRRNKIDGVMGGVCSGLGDYLGLDHSIVRIIFVLAVLFTAFPLLAYFILWIFIPSDKRAPYRREYREVRRARRAQRKNPDTRAESTPPRRTASFRDVKSKYRSLETRMQDLERSITSKEWKLRRDFRDLENN